MRLLIANHHLTLVGGAETYLAAILPPLAADHEIIFVYEAEADAKDPLIPLPPGVQSALATDPAEVLERFRPDLAFLHAPHNLEFQRKLLQRVPTVAFAHGYFGLCISGTKTWKRHPAHPCGQNFSWRCLLHFHAKSCGGSSPITMLRDYRRQSAQLEILRHCDAIIAHAGPLHDEYLTQGVRPERLFALPHFVDKPKVPLSPTANQNEVRLIYVGRFDLLKGGVHLIESLPLVAAGLRRPIRLQMLGSGASASHWKEIAASITAKYRGLRVEFPGWLNREQTDAHLAQSDLLVVPSIWPEPFGQVGLEAAQLGVPAVAFNVGGISTWLHEDVNGHLALANPPDSITLSFAIIKSLGNPDHYAKLRAGALKVASEFSVEQHARALNAVFETVLARRRK